MPVINIVRLRGRLAETLTDKKEFASEARVHPVTLSAFLNERYVPGELVLIKIAQAARAHGWDDVVDEDAAITPGQ